MPHRGTHIGIVLTLVGMLTFGAITTTVDAAPAPSTASSTSLPQPGDRSPAVARLQRLLAVAGLTVAGGADGVYGPATAKSVRRFQQLRGLPVTGIVDQATAEEIGLVAPAAPTSTTPDIRAVQRQLISVGARPKGGADGVYGPATQQALRTFQRWMGLAVTGTLDAATLTALASAAKDAPVPSTSSSSTTAVAAAMEAFPVPTTCMFWDTWGAPRAGGRTHHGVDIFASVGTPVYAVADGRVTSRTADFPGSRGGNQLWLTATTGDRYFYGHLDRFAKGVGAGSPVHAGDVIGYAGTTGLTTVPHLHFEVHPGGGAAVNPYPLLRTMVDC